MAGVSFGTTSAQTLDGVYESVDRLVDETIDSISLSETDEAIEMESERSLDEFHLKSDHCDRPVWISPNSMTFILEKFSPLADQAQEFLASIAEPISRPALIHEYRLTPYSLSAAVSVGFTPLDILQGLDRFCKTSIPLQMRLYISENTRATGKVKLVLRQLKYYLESEHSDILKMLTEDEVIDSARIKSGDDTKEAIEIHFSSIEQVKRRCQQLQHPLLEEYAFRDDSFTPVLDFDIRPHVSIRDYQRESLSKIFSNARARSGIIVLPCGAGKTLVGIAAACTIKKNCLVLCTSSVSVEQWQQQFLQNSTIKKNQMYTFTADSIVSSNSLKTFLRAGVVVVSTYSMVANTGNRSIQSQLMIKLLQEQDWGLLLLDEVHVVPATMFRRVLTTIKGHSKLGLTATLVREDDRIDDLNILVGSKLYEANWLDLANQGHIAKVQCAEVWCPMNPSFYKEYLQETGSRKLVFCTMNPSKFQACQFLIDFHEKRGDKIIVFSDSLQALQTYSHKLNRPCIHGQMTSSERFNLLKQFQTDPKTNTIFLSKVGDTSIDLPEATVLIQISSHFGSRRQEAQRLGRILRAKKRNDEGFSAYFYSLVSRDTLEMYYSTKRQQFLVDQGYTFKVITELDGMHEMPSLVYKTENEQKEFLTAIKAMKDVATQTIRYASSID